MSRSRVAVLLAAVCLLVPAVPASAATAKHGGQCPRGKLCIWTEPGFKGKRTVFSDGADLGGRCRTMSTPIGSVANRTRHSPFRLHLFLFRGNFGTPCDVQGVYAQYVAGQKDPAVPDGPVSGVRIYAEPNNARHR